MGAGARGVREAPTPNTLQTNNTQTTHPTPNTQTLQTHTQTRSAAFDGKHPCRVGRGGAVRFKTSLCPIPLVSKGGLDSDWFEGINQKLKWNQAIRGAPPGAIERWELSALHGGGGGGGNWGSGRGAAAAPAAARGRRGRESGGV